MSKFKVGDKVYSVTDGFGLVKSISGSDKTYPVMVNFGGVNSSYTLSGVEFESDKHPSLFHSPREASEYHANQEPPKMDFDKDCLAALAAGQQNKIEKLEKENDLLSERFSDVNKECLKLEKKLAEAVRLLKEHTYGYTTAELENFYKSIEEQKEKQ